MTIHKRLMFLATLASFALVFLCFGANAETITITGSSGGSGGAVSSVTGTTGQVTCTPTTGNVICSLPSTITEALTFAPSGGQEFFSVSGATGGNATTTISHSTTSTSDQQWTVVNDNGTDSTIIFTNGSARDNTTIVRQASTTAIEATGSGLYLGTSTSTAPVILFAGGVVNGTNNAITVSSPTAIAFNQYTTPGVIVNDSSGNLTSSTALALTSAAIAQGSITTNLKGLNLTATFNAAGTTFDAPLFENITNTASAAGSLIADLQVGGVSTFNVGIAPSSSGPLVLINATGAAPTTLGVLNSTGLQITGNSTAGGSVVLDAIGTTANITINRINGSAASPTAITSAQTISNNVSGGYDSSAIGVGVELQAKSINAWTTSDHSAYLGIFTVAGTTTTLSEKVRFQGSGGVTVGNGVIATDPGASNLLVGGNIAIKATGQTLAAGELGMGEITASGSAPGASSAKMEWVTGTNANTCKLIAYAGTSSTPVTIVDNVGAGCT
jgi:hypothetical protein